MSNEATCRPVIFLMMRIDSTRVPRKMLQKVGRFTLAERNFRLAKEAGELADVPVVCAIWPGDRELVELAKEYAVPMFERSYASAHESDYSTVHGAFVDWMKACGYDYGVYPNACCPFLKPDTIAALVRFGRQSPTRACWLALPERALWVWDQAGATVIRDGTGNTQAGDRYFIRSHAAGAFPLNMMTSYESVMNCSDFLPIEDRQQLIDVDSEDDLKLAQILGNTELLHADSGCDS
jgi:CMP-N-acetylneuraminic acid synthetase